MQADAEQAYVQAELKGPPTYVVLPEEAWPKDPILRKRFERLRQPVVRLRKALYGHPDAGSYWEEHAERGIRESGFKRIRNGSWSSIFWHPQLRVLLMLYVDDFKLAGPVKDLAEGWHLIRGNASSEGGKGLIMEGPHSAWTAPGL